jgi:hypothetical protein
MHFRFKTISLIVFIAMVLFPTQILAEPIEDQTHAVLETLDKSLKDFLTGDRKFVAVGSFFDASSKKHTPLSEAVETALFDQVLRRYGLDRSIAILNWKSSEPISKASISGPYDIGTRGRDVVNRFDSGVLITGLVVESTGGPLIRGDLVDIKTGRILVSAGDTAGVLMAEMGSSTGLQKSPTQPVGSPDASRTESNSGSTTAVVPGTSAASPSSKAMKTGSVTVETDPPGAGIVILEAPEPFAQGMALSPGSYTVLVSAEGYGTATETLEVVAGRDSRLTVRLEPSTEAAGVEHTVIQGKNFKYDGQVKDGRKHGKGILIFSRGDKYDGQWENDQMHGQGTYSYADGEKYSGQWQNGRMHGKGTYTFRNGDRYVGEFRDDQKHGPGTYYFKNGDRWDGHYVRNAKDGEAVYTWASGQSKREVWRNGEQIE